MMYGQFFTTQDVDAAAKTALPGETVAQNLFGDADPTGQVVIIKNVPFTVAECFRRRANRLPGRIRKT